MSHPYRRLAPYFKPHIWILFLSLMCSLAVNIGNLGRLGAIIPAVQKILTKTDIVFAEGVSVPAFLEMLAGKINAMPPLTLIYVLII